MLESAAHPNIVAYHHAWLETVSPLQSRFAPKTPTLHILMEFANGGSLQGFIDARKGASSNPGDVAGVDAAAKLARKRRKEARERAVHLLRLEDILTLFEQVVHGLAFLHSRNILHLDLKVSEPLRRRAPQNEAGLNPFPSGGERLAALGRGCALADVQAFRLWFRVVGRIPPRKK